MTSSSCRRSIRFMAASSCSSAASYTLFCTAQYPRPEVASQMSDTLQRGILQHHVTRHPGQHRQYGQGPSLEAACQGACTLSRSMSPVISSMSAVLRLTRWLSWSTLVMRQRTRSFSSNTSCRHHDSCQRPHQTPGQNRRRPILADTPAVQVATTDSQHTCSSVLIHALQTAVCLADALVPDKAVSDCAKMQLPLCLLCNAQ